MDGLFFLMSIIGVGLAMGWTVQNDRLRPDQPTAGFFAMRVRGLARAKKPSRLMPPEDPPAATSAAPPPRQTPWPRS